jgi:hypothetical protein
MVSSRRPHVACSPNELQRGLSWQGKVIQRDF